MSERFVWLGMGKGGNMNKQIGNMIEIKCAICGKKFLTMRGRNICDECCRAINEMSLELKG